MNLSRVHDYCTSLAVSAMLTSAFLATAPEGFMAAGAGPLGASAALESAMAGLRANGWHGTAGMAIPAAIAAAQTRQVATPPTPTPSPFTEIQLKKFNLYWDTRGKEIEIYSKYSKPLGLTKGDDVIRARKISGRDENKIFHLFGRINNGSGYTLTYEPNPDEVRMFWVGLDFKIIAALSDSKDNGIVVIAIQDAEKELQSEYAEWAKIADKL